MAIPLAFEDFQVMALRRIVWRRKYFGDGAADHAAPGSQISGKWVRDTVDSCSMRLRWWTRASWKVGFIEKPAGAAQIVRELFLGIWRCVILMISAGQPQNGQNHIVLFLETGAVPLQMCRS